MGAQRRGDDDITTFRRTSQPPYENCRCRHPDHERSRCTLILLHAVHGRFSFFLTYLTRLPRELATDIGAESQRGKVGGYVMMDSCAFASRRCELDGEYIGADENSWQTIQSNICNFIDVYV